MRGSIHCSLPLSVIYLTLACLVSSGCEQGVLFYISEFPALQTSFRTKPFFFALKKKNATSYYQTVSFLGLLVSVDHTYLTCVEVKLVNLKVNIRI